MLYWNGNPVPTTAAEEALLVLGGEPYYSCEILRVCKRCGAVIPEALLRYHRGGCERGDHPTAWALNIGAFVELACRLLSGDSNDSTC